LRQLRFDLPFRCFLVEHFAAQADIENLECRFRGGVRFPLLDSWCQHHVGWLHIAVNHPQFVKMLQPIERLTHEAGSFD